MGTTSAESKRNKTIRRIFTAAAKVFSESGFAGARMDEIAKHARVNKATIYYHIGDKKALYAEVLHTIIGEATEQFMDDLQGNESPEKRLKVYIGGVIHTMNRNPYLAPIMLREQASGGRNLPEVIAGDFARIISVLTEILEEGEKQGVFIKTTSFIIHSLFIGGLMFYQSSYPVRSRYSNFLPEPVKKLGADLTDEIAREIENLILKAVKK